MIHSVLRGMIHSVLRGMTHAVLLAGFVVALAALGGASSLRAEDSGGPTRADRPAPTRFILVRHAETVANKTGTYNSRTVNTLTPLGQKQVETVTRKLLKHTFDDLLVSPISRARQTLRPYLEATQRVAQVWPSLAECCHQRDRDVPPSAQIPEGKEITFEPDDAPFFTTEGSPSSRRYWPANYADGMNQIRLLVDRLKSRYAGSGRQVLMISHSIIGSRLIEFLLGLEARGRFRLDNAELTVLEENPDGTFRLLQLNGRKPPAAFR